ncbi:MAG: Ubiquitin- modifier 1 [Icmadophila ericetorum]|nr:Ubiquitin- modifier 1 [Icmadophila ericetorum]
MNAEIPEVETIPIVVEFTGGLEMLFSNQRKHPVDLPGEDENGKAVDMAFLVRYLCSNLMKSPKKDMFVIDGLV